MPFVTLTELGCDHCGGVAIERPDGTYSEDMGGPCAECGFPGRVSIDNNEFDGGVEWFCDEKGTCNDPKCDECNEKKGGAK